MASLQEWLKIERNVVIKAPRSRVWRALTRPEEFASWFNVKLQGDFVPGGKVSLESKYPGHEGTRSSLHVLRMEPEHTFAWRWTASPEVDDIDDESQVTDVVFTLEETPDGTLLTVREEGFERVSLPARAKAFTDNQGGWEIQLRNIEAYVRSAT